MLSAQQIEISLEQGLSFIKNFIALLQNNTNEMSNKISPLQPLESLIKEIEQLNSVLFSKRNLVLDTSKLLIAEQDWLTQITIPNQQYFCFAYWKINGELLATVKNFLIKIVDILPVLLKILQNVMINYRQLSLYDQNLLPDFIQNIISILDYSSQIFFAYFNLSKNFSKTHNEYIQWFYSFINDRFFIRLINMENIFTNKSLMNNIFETNPLVFIACQQKYELFRSLRGELIIKKNEALQETSAYLNKPIYDRFFTIKPIISPKPNLAIKQTQLKNKACT